MKELTVDAVLDSLPEVTAFAEEALEALSCPMRAQMQLNIAIDELFSNIARYAYGDQAGRATVRIGYEEESGCAAVTFIDSGVPYNPLAADDPDTALSADERTAGGLGVFMVKKTMDDVSYAYEDGCNMLTIRKKIR